MKKFLVLVGYVLLNIQILGAIDLYITNDVADMVAAKRICVRINFAESDQALYKDSLCFSVDTPALELKSWRTSAQESLQYIPLLKRGKKLYLRSFNIELTIDFDMQDKVRQAMLLNKTALYISALSLTKNGENKVVNLMVPLAEVIARDYSFTTSFNSLTTSLSTTVTSSWIGRFLSKNFFVTKKLIVNNELLVIDRMKDLWMQIRTLVVRALTSGAFYYWYFGFMALMIFLIFLQRRKRYLVYTWWFWEFEIMLALVGCVGILFICRSFIPRYFLYKTFGFICIPCALYFLWGGQETFWRRFKVLIGLVCATAVLPLLIKGYLLQYLDIFYDKGNGFFCVNIPCSR